MTVAESVAIREKEEALCRSGFCAGCSHGSNFIAFVSVLDKINDDAIENYR